MFPTLVPYGYRQEARAVDRRGIVEQESLSFVPPHPRHSWLNVRPLSGSYEPVLTVPKEMLSDALFEECGAMGVTYRLFAVGEFIWVGLLPLLDTDYHPTVCFADPYCTACKAL